MGILRRAGTDVVAPAQQATRVDHRGSDRGLWLGFPGRQLGF
eukprot:COSAG06_NODE_63310_length_262_cov_1.552147_1_plen_41_part_01